MRVADDPLPLMFDALPGRVVIEHEGEWVVGHAHHATTPSCRRP